MGTFKGKGIIKGNNKGKLMYICRDCKRRQLIKTIFLNRRNGDVCMDCGGRMEADSENAHNKAARATTRRRFEDSGSIITHTHK